MRNLVITGPPGAGKGTQAARMSETYNLCHISTGAILRDEMKSASDLGQQIGEVMQKGELVPDKLVIDIVAKTIAKPTTSSGFLFDGFPRTKQQAQSLDRILAESGSEIWAAVNLDVPETVLIERVLGREDARADDNIEILKERLRVYQADTFPLLDYYRAAGKLKEINGDQNPEQVFTAIQEALAVAA
jgi:adenylate kinase